MRKKLFLLILLAIGLPVLFRTTQKRNTPPVKSAISQEKWDTDLVFAGKIKADRQVDLKFAISGKLVWVGVKEGDQVKKGQAIASLDKRELEKNFKKEMNDYLNERWDFEQTHDDYQFEEDHRLITDEIKRILEKAQFDLNNAVLDVEIKKLAIEYATLISPIDGIVTSIDQMITPVYITPAKAVFTIADPTSLYFEAEIDEEEISQIKENMTGKIVLDAYPDQEFDTKILNIAFAPISGKSNTVYATKTTLPENKNLQFRLGMGGEIELNND